MRSFLFPVVQSSIFYIQAAKYQLLLLTFNLIVYFSFLQYQIDIDYPKKELGLRFGDAIVTALPPTIVQMFYAGCFISLIRLWRKQIYGLNPT